MSAIPERDLYLNMPLEEKRKLYKCGNSYVEIQNIPSWKDISPGNCGNAKFAVDNSINSKVCTFVGNITTLEIDAIVNATKNSLLGSAGVDGAIHRAAGQMLERECATLNGCETGEAKITGGYMLPANYVIPTVGPIGEVQPKLFSCYQNCLRILLENGLRTIAFPCISTGAHGYPSEEAAHVALGAVRNWLVNEAFANQVDRIIFCLFLPKDIKIYERLMPIYFPSA